MSSEAEREYEADEKLLEELEGVTLCWDCHPDPFLYEDPEPFLRKFHGTLYCDYCGVEV